MKIISGTTHPDLSQKILSLGNFTPLSCLISKFSDGEIRVEIHENVENCPVVLIQSTGPPVNENYMELFILLDALKRAGAREVTVVFPYFGYSRQDRKTSPGSPISGGLMASLCEQAGASQAVILDIHSEKIQNFFKIPVHHVSAIKMLAERWPDTEKNQTVCVSPDKGGLKRAEVFSKILGGEAAYIVKERPTPGKAQALSLEGNVQGKNAILVDDIIDTAGTLITAVDKLLQNGAKSVSAVAVHGLLSPPAVERLEKSPIKEIWITDSLALNHQAKKCSKIKIVSAAHLLVQSIRETMGEKTMN